MGRDPVTDPLRDRLEGESEAIRRWAARVAAAERSGYERGRRERSVEVEQLRDRLRELEAMPSRARLVALLRRVDELERQLGQARTTKVPRLR
jgi:hypothetical protein